MALTAVERMLVLRKTHSKSESRLDWLILPELAVHPRDVRTHLIPFARAHRTIVLAGLTYERLPFRQPLVNSALWIIPEWSPTYGLQMRILRQGKYHLAPDELKLNVGSTRIEGFRPCQWLVGYPWSNDPSTRPMWLTASVCYDATDLSMVADLRDESDVFAIPALNKIEAKLTEDDGIARDKVTRVQHLGSLGMEGQPQGQPRFEVVACIAERGFGVRREDMKKLLLATRGKVFTLQNMRQLVNHTRLAEFRSR